MLLTTPAFYTSILCQLWPCDLMPSKSRWKLVSVQNWSFYSLVTLVCCVFWFFHPMCRVIMVLLIHQLFVYFEWCCMISVNYPICLTQLVHVFGRGGGEEYYWLWKPILATDYPYFSSQQDGRIFCLARVVMLNSLQACPTNAQSFVGNLRPVQQTINHRGDWISHLFYFLTTVDSNFICCGLLLKNSCISL